MSLLHSPKIVTDGLVLCLDAADPRSYPKSGTTWSDLVGSVSATMHNMQNSFVKRHGGIFTLDGTDEYISMNLGTGYTHLSMEIWIKRIDTSTSARYIWDARNGGGTWLLTEYIGYDWSWGDIARFNDDNSYLGWNQVFAVKDNTSCKIYLNGNLKTTGGNVDGDLGSNFYIGVRYTGTAGGTTEGEISLFRIYDRVLTEDEVLQNYNATKRRFK